jgi:hypothetical protein
LNVSAAKNSVRVFEPASCATYLVLNSHFGEANFGLKLVIKSVELDGASFGLKIVKKSASRLTMFCCQNFASISMEKFGLKVFDLANKISMWVHQFW